MTIAKHSSELQAALEIFESSLESPVVPGELDQWLTTAGGGLRNLKEALQDRVQHVHPEQLEDIRQQDPELADRVQHLEEVDHKLLKQFDELVRRVEELRSRLQKNGASSGLESRVARSVERLGEQGLKFVIDVRKQEAALTTWFMEAFDRDRGIAD